MTSQKQSTMNGWLTPALLVTILLAVISGGWFVVDQATGSLRKQHESDIKSLYILVNDRHVTVTQSLSEIKTDLKELKKILLERR